MVSQRIAMTETRTLTPIILNLFPLLAVAEERVVEAVVGLKINPLKTASAHLQPERKRKRGSSGMKRVYICSLYVKDCCISFLVFVT